jgi:hypothetical protein
MIVDQSIVNPVMPQMPPERRAYLHTWLDLLVARIPYLAHLGQQHSSN